jgi:transposase-like protein
MNLTYSSAFKEQALVKVYSRGDRTIQSVAEELNVKLQTLKIWMKRKMKQTRDESAGSIKEKRPQDWRVEEQLQALHESYGLTGEALNAWCRERGLFAHHLASWKAAFCSVQISTEMAPPSKREIRDLKDENHQLKRELNRKEKALAEAAALLILQKKFQALWEGEEK